MAFRFLPLAMLALANIAMSAPITLEDLELAEDTQSVGSYVREVRAAPPNYHISYSNDGDGEIGYSRKKDGGGKKGYQHFDSFHKKAGDNYEFEKADSYGQDNGANEGGHEGAHEGAHSHNHEQKEKKPARYTQRPEHSEAEEEEEEGTGASAEAAHDAELKDAPDGNGGVEAQGHNKADYKLPEKYTYGSGEEYNF